MKRSELLSVPKRKCDETMTGVTGVYVIPSGRKHESGYTCMDFVSQTQNGLVRFGGCCDDVRLKGSNFRMDCEYPSRIIHIWNSSSTFKITHDLSTIDFIEDAD